MLNFDKIKPYVLGACFDILAKSMDKIYRIQLAKLPRMADFALWGCAIAESIGYSQKDFLDAYYVNIGQQDDEAINASVSALCVIRFMENKSEWNGKSEDLFKELEFIAQGMSINTKNNKSWPGNADWLIRRLNEVGSNLKKQGIIIVKRTHPINAIVITNLNYQEPNYTINF